MIYARQTAEKKRNTKGQQLHKKIKEEEDKNI